MSIPISPQIQAALNNRKKHKRLSTVEKEVIADRRNSGYSVVALAKEFDVSPGTIYNLFR